MRLAWLAPEGAFCCSHRSNMMRIVQLCSMCRHMLAVVLVCELHKDKWKQLLVEVDHAPISKLRSAVLEVRNRGQQGGGGGREEGRGGKGRGQ